MRIRFAVIALFALTSAAVAEDGAVVSRSFDFANFDRIQVAGVYEIRVANGPRHSIKVSGAANEMQHIAVSVDAGVLRFGNVNPRKTINRNQRGVLAEIEMPVLRGLKASGVVDGELFNIDCQKLEIEISGVADIRASGVCHTLTAVVSGVGELDARALKCQNVVVSVAGVGSAKVFAAAAVDARVSGMGDIRVYGHPKQISKSGGFLSEISID